MVFCIKSAEGVPNCTQLRRSESTKRLNLNNIANGAWIAIIRVPVMYRLLGESCQPKEQQTPGKSIRQRSGPKKGLTGWESLHEARWR
jgi:hypothetical protein